MKNIHSILKVSIPAIVLLLSWCGNVASQPQNSPENETMFRENYPAEELKADLDFLVAQLRSYHPVLFAHLPERSFDNLSSAAYELVKQDAGLIAFYKIIAPFVSKIGCSHTGTRLPQKYLVREQEVGNYLPLDLYIAEEAAYYLNLANDARIGIEKGSEILSINKVPMKNIVEILLAMIPSEGNSRAGKLYLLNHHFPEYFHLLSNAEKYEIEFLTKAGATRYTIDACNYDLIRQQGPGDWMPSPVECEFDRDHKTGLITVPTFAIIDMNGYMALLDSLFILLKKEEAENLVVDLRDNEGGHPIFAAQLFSYLAKEEFTWFERNADVPDFEPLYHPMQPNPSHFTGRVLVLVNEGCLSTTGHLISQIKYHTDAIFIGSEPGSTFSCNDMSMHLTLSNTGIEVSIPRTTFVTAIPDSVKMQPFHVDHSPKSMLSDKLNGVDGCMELADKIIGK